VSPRPPRPSAPRQTLSVKSRSPLANTDNWPAFASCPRGLENALSDELRGLGAQAPQPVQGGVEFSASWLNLLRMNLWSSLAGRILMRVQHAPCGSDGELYQLVKDIAWQDWFDVKKTLRVDLNNLGVSLPNARFLQLRVKDAVCDYFLDTTGQRPSIDLDEPDIHIIAAVGPTHSSVYLDLSGENLFKRGWREEKGLAPLKENLAAGVLTLAGWTAEMPLLDPFCGSGTILIEAACRATGRAPGLARRFAFENLKGFDPKPWQSMKEEARTVFETGLKQATGLQLVGSDITRVLIDLALRNAELAGLASLLEDGRLRFEQRDARHMEPIASTGLIITNPPYGERLQAKGSKAVDDEAYEMLFADLGSRLKEAFAGWRFFCLTADLEVRRVLGLSPKRKTPLFNGGLDCRLFEFPMAAGQYRPHEKKT
jgi:putative N6-adenine-specific DNA methylase